MTVLQRTWDIIYRGAPGSRTWKNMLWGLSFWVCWETKLFVSQVWSVLGLACLDKLWCNKQNVIFMASSVTCFISVMLVLYQSSLPSALPPGWSSSPGRKSTGPWGRLRSLRPIWQRKSRQPQKGREQGKGRITSIMPWRALPASSKIQGLLEGVYFCLHQNRSLIIFRFNFFHMNLSSTLLNPALRSYSILWQSLTVITTFWWRNYLPFFFF